MYVSSQFKYALKKFGEESKDRDCDLCMSDVFQLYKSCVAHLDKWTTLFALYFNVLTKFFCCKWKMLNHVNSICLRNVSIDEAKLFDQYQNLFEFVQKEHQTNAIYCKMMEHERWAKYFVTCNTIECFTELINIA